MRFSRIRLPDRDSRLRPRKVAGTGAKLDLVSGASGSGRIMQAAKQDPACYLRRYRVFHRSLHPQWERQVLSRFASDLLRCLAGTPCFVGVQMCWRTPLSWKETWWDTGVHDSKSPIPKLLERLFKIQPGRPGLPAHLAPTKRTWHQWCKIEPCGVTWLRIVVIPEGRQSPSTRLRQWLSPVGPNYCEAIAWDRAGRRGGRGYSRRSR